MANKNIYQQNNEFVYSTSIEKEKIYIQSRVSYIPSCAATRWYSWRRRRCTATSTVRRVGKSRTTTCIYLKRVTIKYLTRKLNERIGKRNTYISPAAAESGQQLPEVSSCLTDGPAGGQVVAGCQNTDYLGCPRQNCIQHLTPQLSRARPWCRHQPEGELALWHGDKPIYDGSQMGVTNQESKLQRQRKSH